MQKEEKVDLQGGKELHISEYTENNINYLSIIFYIPSGKNKRRLGVILPNTKGFSIIDEEN